MPAQLILTNARIYSCDEKIPLAEALAVRDGLIAGIGVREDVLALADHHTRVVDLGGRTVLPGLVDAHVHLLEFALRLRRVELSGAGSLAEALGRVRLAAENSRSDDWVLGGGFDSNQWERLPTRFDLDAVSPDKPVFLMSKDMHSAWANSLALKAADIDRHTLDPAGGEILCDAVDGEPTGILRESAASIVARAAGLVDTDASGDGLAQTNSQGRCDDALINALRVAAGRGVTGMHVPEGPRSFAALQRLRSQGRLPLRIWCHLRRESLPEALKLGLRTGFGDGYLKVGHLKLFLDGALGSQTDHTLEPHLGTSSRGIETMAREELEELVAAAARGGIAPAIHAIGDAANRVALDVLEKTSPLWKGEGLRPRIEHLQLVHRDDLGRVGRLGIIASMQPSHQPSDWIIADRHWGPSRTPLAYAWRSLLNSGAVLAFGSDCPVEPIDPLAGLHAAVMRQTAEGLPEGGWHPEQRLTPLEALRAFTLGPAYATGEERIKGSLSAGKLADFVVLSEDPFSGTPGSFLRSKVEATVVNGKIVHGSI